MESLTTKKICMDPRKFPPEIKQLIGQMLLTDDYCGFWSYLNLRNTWRDFNGWLAPVTYDDLMVKNPHLFKEKSIVPCKDCKTIRPRTHFFKLDGNDGVGHFYKEGHNETCIDCAVKKGIYKPGDRFWSEENIKFYCVCAHCANLGKSSVDQQVCCDCFDAGYVNAADHPPVRESTELRVRYTDVLQQPQFAYFSEESEELRMIMHELGAQPLSGVWGQFPRFNYPE